MQGFSQRSIPSHYFVLKKLCAKIEEEAAGFYMQDCLTLNKNEFIIRLRFKENIYLFEAYLGEEESFVFFPERVSIPREPKFHFPELLNQKLIFAKAHWHDRSFSLFFEDYSLFFKLYGRNANVVLFKKNKIIGLLKPQFQNDLELQPYKTGKKLDPTFDDYLNLQQEIGAEKAVLQLFPSFNKNFFLQLKDQVWENKNPETQWEMLQQLLIYLEDPDFFILFDENQKVKYNTGVIFSLLHYNEEILHQTKDVKEALNSYSKEYLSARYFLLRKNEILDNLRQKAVKIQTGIASAQKHLQHLDEDKNYKIQADLLMANIHKIPAKATEVEVYDFYQDKNIVLTLKKDISPQKWAEKLYKKSKNQEIEREKVIEKILFLEDEAEKIKKEIIKISLIQTNKELRNLQKNDTKSTIKDKTQVSPFKRFEFEGYEVFVGKSAKNNDELTLKFARKDDLWLHARGVSGSHVIIRKKGQQQIPVSVVRKAAQLAAYYSKGKSASLCPVIYTPKKYVRKPKGAEPGAVIVDKEEVILAEPASFEALEK